MDEPCLTKDIWIQITMMLAAILPPNNVLQPRFTLLTTPKRIQLYPRKLESLSLLTFQAISTSTWCSWDLTRIPRTVDRRLHAVTDF